MTLRQAASGNKSGFTLIEVVIALAIFAIATWSLTQSFLGGMYSIESFREENYEEIFLQSLYNSIASFDDIGSVESGGEIEFPNDRKARMEVDVEEAQVKHLFRVTATVTFIEGKVAVRGGRPIRETFYLFRPKWKLK